jgi:flagellar hook-basal body complex protein FliE
MTIEAITAAAGHATEWAMPQIEPLGPEGQLESSSGADAVSGATSAGGSSFGDVLTKAVGELNQTQVDAATEAQKLATGQSSDVNSVVMAAERAQMSMALAATVRDKSVMAINDILRTQV